MALLAVFVLLFSTGYVGFDSSLISDKTASPSSQSFGVPTINAYIPLGSGARASAYDPANGYLYVPTYNNGLAIVNTKTDTCVTEVDMGSDLFEALYDPSNSYVYIISQQEVFVMSTYTDRIVSTITLNSTIRIHSPIFPNSPVHLMAYDPVSGNIFIPMYDSYAADVADFLVIDSNDNSWSFLSVSVPNGMELTNVFYIPVKNQIMVCQYSSSYIYVLNGTNGKFLSSLTVGNSPDDILYDSISGDLMALSYNSGTLSVIDPYNDTVLYNLPLGNSSNPLNSLTSIALDPNTGQLWVGGLDEGSVAVLNQSGSDAPTVDRYLSVSSSYSSFILYDPHDNSMYIAQESVEIFNASTYQKITDIVNGLKGNTIYEEMFINSTNEVYLFPEANLIDVIYGKASTDNIVTFSVNGLPQNEKWNLTFNGSTYELSGSQYTFDNVPNGTYSYSVSSTIYGGFGTRYFTGNSGGSFSVNGGNVFEDIQYVAQYQVFTSASPATEGVVSPASGAAWYDSGTMIVLEATAYAGYTFEYFKGTGTGNYSGTSSNVDLNVNGPIIETAYFDSTNPVYTVKFSETGLPAGVSWTVDLGQAVNTSSASTMVFHEMDGTYQYTVQPVTGYTSSISQGSIIVDGSNINEQITFRASTQEYYIDFSETGLPMGTSWSVTLNGVLHSFTTSTADIPASDGTYQYSIGNIAGYTASPSSGSITVNGANQNVPITFKQSSATYSVTFNQNGLSSNTKWTVDFNQIVRTQSGSSITFSGIPDGNYFYTIENQSGYIASPASGKFSVNAESGGVYITFYPVTFSLSVSNGTGHYVQHYREYFNVSHQQYSGISTLLEQRYGTNAVLPLLQQGLYLADFILNPQQYPIRAASVIDSEGVRINGTPELNILEGTLTWGDVYGLNNILGPDSGNLNQFYTSYFTTFRNIYQNLSIQRAILAGLSAPNIISLIKDAFSASFGSSTGAEVGNTISLVVALCEGYSSLTELVGSNNANRVISTLEINGFVQGSGYDPYTLSHNILTDTSGFENILKTLYSDAFDSSLENSAYSDLEKVIEGLAVDATTGTLSGVVDSLASNSAYSGVLDTVMGETTFTVTYGETSIGSVLSDSFESSLKGGIVTAAAILLADIIEQNIPELLQTEISLEQIILPMLNQMQSSFGLLVPSGSNTANITDGISTETYYNIADALLHTWFSADYNITKENYIYSLSKHKTASEDLTLDSSSASTLEKSISGSLSTISAIKTDSETLVTPAFTHYNFTDPGVYHIQDIQQYSEPVKNWNFSTLNYTPFYLTFSDSNILGFDVNSSVSSFNLSLSGAIITFENGNVISDYTEEFFLEMPNFTRIVTFGSPLGRYYFSDSNPVGVEIVRLNATNATGLASASIPTNTMQSWAILGGTHGQVVIQPGNNRVRFVESGLANQTWYVKLGNNPIISINSTSYSIVGLNSSTLYFEIFSPTGYESNPSTGNVTFRNSTFTVSIVFSKISGHNQTGNSTVLQNAEKYLFAGVIFAVIIATGVGVLSRRKR